MNDGDKAKTTLRRLGISEMFAGRSIAEIKTSERDWRLFIQSAMYRELVERCGAKHYTPFFIRNRGGHGDYWLVHMSQHPRARDVMTEVHWSNNNYFIHYAGSGLDMFQMAGYDPVHDAAHRGQAGLGFEFDDVARKASIAALSDQIPRRIYAAADGLTFADLFTSTCNGSPASARLYREALALLVKESEIAIIGADGSRRKAAAQIKDSDRLLRPTQSLLFPGHR